MRIQVPPRLHPIQREGKSYTFITNQTQIFPWAFSEIRILNRNNACLFIYSHQKKIDNRTKLFLDQFFIQEWESIECKWTEINLLCFSATLLVWKGLYTAFDKNKAFFKHNIVFFISQCVLRRRSETKKLKVWSYLHFTECIWQIYPKWLALRFRCTY